MQIAKWSAIGFMTFSIVTSAARTDLVAAVPVADDAAADSVGSSQA